MNDRHMNDKREAEVYHPGPKDEHQRKYEEEPRRFNRKRKRT